MSLYLLSLYMQLFFRIGQIRLIFQASSIFSSSHFFWISLSRLALRSFPSSFNGFDNRLTIPSAFLVSDLLMTIPRAVCLDFQLPVG